MTNGRAITVALASLVLLTAHLGGAAPAHAAGTSLVIAVPAESAAVTGAVTVTVTGTPDLADPEQKLYSIFLESNSATQVFMCSAVPGAGCVANFVWDTLGLADGPHSFRARMDYRSGSTDLTMFTPFRTMSVSNPPSTVAFTGLSDGQIVTGPVELTFTGVIPDSVDARASAFALYGGDDFIDYLYCPPSDTPKTCTIHYLWKPAWAGPLRLHAYFNIFSTVSSAVQSTDSASITPLVQSGTDITMTAPTSVNSGKREAFRGTVEATGNLAPVAGVKVKLTLTRGAGSPVYLSARTNTNGRFVIPWTFRSNTSVKAEVVPESWWRTSSTRTVTKVRATLVCSVAATSVRRGRAAVGVCRAANLPVGTLVRLQVFDPSPAWTNIAIGRTTRTGIIPFAFSSSARGPVSVRILVSASKVYTATLGPAVKVTFI